MTPHPQPTKVRRLLVLVHAYQDGRRVPVRKGDIALLRKRCIQEADLKCVRSGIGNYRVPTVTRAVLRAIGLTAKGK
jgi:hypothetical protein